MPATAAASLESRASPEAEANERWGGGGGGEGGGTPDIFFFDFEEIFPKLS